MTTYAEVHSAEQAWTPDQPIPEAYTEWLVRNAAPEQPRHFVLGRVPFGIWLHAAPAGGYKSAIAAQIEQAIVYGVKIPGLDWEFTRQGDVLVVTPDESFGEVQDRSFTIVPGGDHVLDGEDRQHPRGPRYEIHYRHGLPGETIQDRIAWLWLTVAEIEAATGRPVVWIRMDTIAALVGDSEKNAYDQASPLRELNHRLANESRVLFGTQHLNKAGTPMGTTGFQGNANLNTIGEVFTEDNTGTIRVNGKARGCQHWQAAAVYHDGIAERLVDESPQSMMHATGTRPRRLVDILAAGPASVGELQDATGWSNRVVWTNLARLKRAREVEKLPDRRWQLVDNGREAPAGPPRWTEGNETFGVCAACGRRMLVMEPDQTTHPNCGPGIQLRAVPDPPAEEAPEAPAEPAPEPSGDALDDTSPAERIDGFGALQASIDKSRMHPVKRVFGKDRDSEPWTLITERMTGEHRWVQQVPEAFVRADPLVLVLDRNGSYPSAMGSVPVAANLLKHTGSLRATDAEIKAAGLFEIKRIDWYETGIGHPLGKIAEDDSPSWWITTPHLRLLQQLQHAGRIDAPQVIDSWTGRATNGLFTRFSKEVQELRTSAMQAGDFDRYAQVKRATSIAIRCLWPKAAGSPFWRPDWSVSVRAEAAVRHWVRADQALHHGAVLLKLGAVDEVAVVQQAKGEVPRPYVLGDRYGQVKVKEQLSYAEWAARRGNRAR